MRRPASEYGQFLKPKLPVLPRACVAPLIISPSEPSAHATVPLIIPVIRKFSPRNSNCPLVRIWPVIGPQDGWPVTDEQSSAERLPAASCWTVSVA